MRHLILPRLVLPCLAATALVAGLPAAALAQGMKIPGETTTQTNIVKPAPLEATSERIAALGVPPGSKIEKFADGLKTPRVIVVGADGNLYVSSRDEGTISLLAIRDGKAGPARTVLSKPNVHGMAINQGRLFYVTIREIFWSPINADGSLGPETRIVGDLPDAGQHPNRTLAFGPDGLLYVSVGSTCNDCEENNPENATLLRMKPDGTAREIVASGLRNTIAFAWQPGTGALYGLDNGVDAFGDDEQPEELNRIENGKKYGWPYILGNGMKHPLREPKKGTLDDWDKSSVRPAQTYTAHAASMQMVFADRSSLPAEYRGDAFATMHGSWNRKPPSGYEVVRIHFENGQPKSIQPFVSGFLVQQGDGKWGRFARPFGLAVAADGSLLLGDEQNGILYRISQAK
jgi:glucose/arabinose dehydrogenase